MVLVIIFLLTGIAVSTTDCQEDMGLCQGERPARPERQTPNPVRRAHEGSVQAGQNPHVHNE